MRYLRWVTSEIDPGSDSRRGLLSVAYELLRQDKMELCHEQMVNADLSWLGKNLPTPKRFSRKKNCYHKEKTLGISWVKDNADDVIGRLRSIALVISEYVVVEEISTYNPGYVIYEDSYQVVAEPFKKGN